MTDGMTMTPEIAASILDGTSKYRPHPTHVEDAKLFAARVLRSVATASADAETGEDAHKQTIGASIMRIEIDAADYDALKARVELLENWQRCDECSAELVDGGEGIGKYCIHCEQRARIATLEADLDAVCGEVERVTEIVWATADKSADRAVDNGRPPRVTEILAERKERRNE